MPDLPSYFSKPEIFKLSNRFNFIGVISHDYAREECKVWQSDGNGRSIRRWCGERFVAGQTCFLGDLVKLLRPVEGRHSGQAKPCTAWGTGRSATRNPGFLWWFPFARGRRLNSSAPRIRFGVHRYEGVSDFFKRIFRMKGKYQLVGSSNGNSRWRSWGETGD